MTDLLVGARVHVKMFNGTTIEGIVKKIEETTQGTRLSVSSGDLALLRVRPEQIIKAFKTKVVADSDDDELDSAAAPTEGFVESCRKLAKKLKKNKA
jgi:hypothetical protein